MFNWQLTSSCQGWLENKLAENIKLALFIVLLVFIPNFNPAFPHKTNFIEQEPDQSSQTINKTQNNNQNNIVSSLIQANLALQNGSYSDAASNFLSLAQQLQSSELAEKATLIALQTKNLNIASQASTLWAKLAPKDKTAQFYYIVLLISDQPNLAMEAFNNFSFANPKETINFANQIEQALATEHAKKNWVTIINKLKNQQKNNPNLLIISARQNFEAGKFKEALSEINAVLIQKPNLESALVFKSYIIAKLDPKMALKFVNIQLNQTPAQEFYFAKLNILYSLGNYAEASQLINELVNNYPNEIEIQLKIAKILIEHHQYKMAKTITESILQKQSDNNQARWLLANVFFELKHYREAYEWFHSINSGKYFTPSRLKAVEILNLHSESDAAIHALNQIILATPSEINQWLILKSDALMNKNQKRQALFLINQGLEQFPGSQELLIQKEKILKQF